MRFTKMLAVLLMSLLATTLSGGASAEGEHSQHSAHDHAKHTAMLSEQKQLKRSDVQYQLPSVELVDQAGNELLITELNHATKPQAVNFIFATCTTICPVMTATFAQMRRELGDDASRIEMLSITIDPEHDTPSVLSDYADLFNAPAPPEWRFLTGHPEDVEQVLRSMDAWWGSKTNHKPVTLMRGVGQQGWTRFEGMGSGVELAREALALLN